MRPRAALANRISGAISRQNRRELRQLYAANAGTKNLWRAVNTITKSKGCDAPRSNISADYFNAFYAATSTNNSYEPPTLKHTANPNCQIVSETQIFHHLDHLRPTAEGADHLPSWFL